MNGVADHVDESQIPDGSERLIGAAIRRKRDPIRC